MLLLISVISWRFYACQWRTNCLLNSSIFWGAYPHHYTPMRCCAQRLGPHDPPYTIRVAQNTKMTKPYTSAWNVFLMQQVLKSWALVRTRAQFSCFFYFFAKKKAKKRPSDFAKIELSFEPELNFCNFWGLQNEPPKALWTPTWLHNFS